ncbi:alpha/beta fold hydrolase [Amycolatopsis rhabdoformis]|uniref:Alpha/beta fold hydrolase n=1 Tax=Amycolatopsis rhabdoformis TaxID=1448059 RepID=A0ABZ1IJJ7_9PSEU|nr:alpha/beta fold hydrolase [Amycolatopsis rhabdoformis]WSE34635.1 alpha/beta fold hydrolase [Amycolatopsis rhabdoformis]
MLGTDQTVSLPGGRVAYAEAGSGPPVVFVHGLLVNANLWRHVVPPVAAAGFRCLAPDWPLGAHHLPMAPDADLTPPGVARLLGQFLDALDLTDVTLVANDTGGALTQLLMAENPARVGRVVLTPCDAFEEFFPAPFSTLPRLMRLPGAAWLTSRLLQVPLVRRHPATFGALTRRPIPARVLDSYLRPAHTDPAIRRDLRRFLLTVDPRHTLAAAEALPAFTKPVLLLRAADDRVFPPGLFDRLAALLPDARLVTVADSGAFLPEDRPAELARLIVDFAS